MPRKRKPNTDYEVGYGKPPEKSQWKAGQSGNPKGRPSKKTKPQSAYAKDDPNVFANTLMTVRIDGKEVQVTRSEAFYIRVFQAAMEGKAWAARMTHAIFEKGKEDHAEALAIWLDMESQLDPERLDQVPKKMQMAINMSRKYFGVPPIAFTEADSLKMAISRLESDPELANTDVGRSYLQHLREELARAQEREGMKRKGRRR